MTLLKAYANPSDMDYYKKFCKPEFAGMTKLSAPEVLRDGYCPAMLIPSRPFTRRCFPALRAKKGMITIDNHTTFDDGMGERRNVTDLLEGAKKANVVLEARQVAMKIFEDYTVSWHWILLGLVIAMVISLIFVVLLRFLAGIMVWVMIVLVLLVLGYAETNLAGFHFLSTSNEPVYKVFPNNTNYESSCIYSRKTCDPQIAIYGKNFCTSARNAFFLLMRNIVRVAVLNKVTEFLLFLGKLLIVGSVGILSFFFFSGRIKPIEDTAPTLNYYWVPILTVVIGSYFIAHGFFSVYGMCVDTLFLCFLEDLERNDGSQERPYFMPDTLLKALKKKNEAKPSE
ncbi:UNVERIFIED_CONTAM: hypothetical protein FKN15_022973 [Acipenser sinensis]